MEGPLRIATRRNHEHLVARFRNDTADLEDLRKDLTEQAMDLEPGTARSMLMFSIANLQEVLLDILEDQEPGEPTKPQLN
jgi:hypothetical protein